MTCPICQRWAPPDPETGYDADDVCPDCAAEGWTYDAHGVLINDREGPCETCADGASDQCATCGFDRPLCICQPKAEPVSEFDQVRR